MNKNIAITIGVLLILLIGGVLFFFMKKPSNKDVTSTANQAVKTTENQQTTASTSLKDLIAKNLAETCTYSNDAGSGTVYVNSGKVRGDFEVNVSGQIQKSHMIIDGNTSYVWMEGENTGYKMTFDPNQVQPTTAEVTSAPQESFSADRVMNYDCKPWVVDSSLFTLPSDIKFTEFTVPTGMMQVSGASPSAGSNSSQCAYCDSLTGDSKTQCLTALHCN